MNFHDKGLGKKMDFYKKILEASLWLISELRFQTEAKRFLEAEVERLHERIEEQTDKIFELEQQLETPKR